MVRNCARRSRVLNFVFLQLMQEFYTITYLDNVSFVYANGYDTSRKTGTLSSMENLLRAVLADKDAIEQVKNDIYVHLCNIPDANGTRTPFTPSQPDGAPAVISCQSFTS